MSTRNIYFIGEIRKISGALMSEALLMSARNICFLGEIRKISCGYLLLSGPVL